MEAVSYTHLDVYKRQEVQAQAAEDFSEKAQKNLERELTVKDILGQNKSADAIYYDLELPKEAAGIKLDWSSSNADVIAADGTPDSYTHLDVYKRQYLDSLGKFEYGGGGYHGVYLTEEDMDIFEKHKLSVVTNPASNMKLASGIAPIARLMERGINLAIGTDGPASNNCLDMFREMFLVTGLAKLREKDAAAVDADEVLRMATVGGAKAMGLEECDTLKAGKLADLIMIDLHQPNMQPLNNISKNLVYSGSKQNVILTMVNGKILYESGEFRIGDKPEEIYDWANRIINRIR